MSIVATTIRGKTWNDCKVTAGGEITESECKRISSIPQKNAAYCTMFDCQCPWRHRKSQDDSKGSKPKFLTGANDRDTDQMVEWSRLMKEARKAVDTMELVRLDPDKCIPFQGKSGQPRKGVNIGADDLTDSIRSAGQWTPGVVRPKNGKNEILSGERRWHSVRRIKDRKYIAIRVKVEDDRVIPFILACIANGNTSPLKPLEMCSAIEELYDHQELPMPYIAKTIFGIEVQKAHAYHRLVHLREEVRTMLAEGKITESDAFRLAGMDYKEQLQKAEDLVAGKTMRQLADPVPKSERGYAKARKVAKPDDPITRLTEFSRRLELAAQRFEKVLNQIDIAAVLKGKIKKVDTIDTAIFNAHDMLGKCRKRIKASMKR